MTVVTSPSERYTQALAKGGSLLPETRLLLESWSPDEPERTLADRVLGTDLLGRATARRVLDIVRVFSLRFLTPDDRPARHVKRVIQGDASERLYVDLIYLYTVRRDALLRDFVVSTYWPSVREGRLVMTNKDVMKLILDAEADGRIAAPWSEEIRRDMCGRVMIALTDFGLLRPVKPAVREVAAYRPADETLIYLAYLLHDRGITDAALGAAEEWGWFGLEPTDVWNQLGLLAHDGWFLIQRAGSVNRITWLKHSFEEVLDGLA